MNPPIYPWICSYQHNTFFMASTQLLFLMFVHLFCFDLSGYLVVCVCVCVHMRML